MTRIVCVRPCFRLLVLSIAAVSSIDAAEVNGVTQSNRQLIDFTNPVVLELLSENYDEEEVEGLRTLVCTSAEDRLEEQSLILRYFRYEDELTNRAKYATTAMDVLDQQENLRKNSLKIGGALNVIGGLGSLWFRRHSSSVVEKILDVNQTGLGILIFALGDDHLSRSFEGDIPNFPFSRLLNLAKNSQTNEDLNFLQGAIDHRWNVYKRELRNAKPQMGWIEEYANGMGISIGAYFESIYAVNENKALVLRQIVVRKKLILLQKKCTDSNSAHSSFESSDRNVKNQSNPELGPQQGETKVDSNQSGD